MLGTFYLSLITIPDNAPSELRHYLKKVEIVGNDKLLSHLLNSIIKNFFYSVQYSLSCSGEGMGGSLFWQDLLSLACSVGFSTPHLVSSSHIMVHNCELKAKAGTRRRLRTILDCCFASNTEDAPLSHFTGDIRYASGTYRLFKLPKTPLMSKAIVTYKGTVADFQDQLEFDSTHTFKVQKSGDAEKADCELLLWY